MAMYVTTEEIDKYINEKGKGSSIKALKVALVEIKRLEKLLANVARGYHVWKII